MSSVQRLTSPPLPPKSCYLCSVPRLLPTLRLPTNVLSLRLARWLMLGITLIGMLGFRFIEGYSWIDALYMTIITISTVGFGEVEPLSTAGRIFASFFVIINVGVLSYALAAFSYYVIEGKIFKNMHEAQIRRTINQLEGHTIVCGFGRYGHEIIQHLRQHGQAFVLLDSNEEKFEDLRGEDQELLYLVGDATHDELLEEAGIARAGSMITALGDDSDNLFIVLSARQLNPKLRIISRAKEVRTRKKMLRAGANHVIMPEQIGGFYMATLINKPNAVEFFSFITNELNADIGFEEIRYETVPAEFRGRPIKDLAVRSKTGVNIISYRLPNGSYQVNPGPETILQPGGSFIVLGTDKQLAALHDYLEG